MKEAVKIFIIAGIAVAVIISALAITSHLMLMQPQVFAQNQDILTRIKVLENQTDDLQEKIDELKETIETMNETLSDPEKCAVCEKTQPPPSNNQWGNEVLTNVGVAVITALTLLAVQYVTRRKPDYK